MTGSTAPQILGEPLVTVYIVTFFTFYLHVLTPQDHIHFVT